MGVKDIANLIERLEAFEDRLGVRLESMSADIDEISDDSLYLTVRGELHSNSGLVLEQNLELIVAAYDLAFRVVGTSKHYIESDAFYGFEIFEIVVSIPEKTLSRIRIYPTRR